MAGGQQIACYPVTARGIAVPIASPIRPTLAVRGRSAAGVYVQPAAALSRLAKRAAVSEFITTALLEAPLRVGKPLRGDVSGVWSARRGTYRVLYRIQEQSREVIVVRIEHRRDVYWP